MFPCVILTKIDQYSFLQRGSYSINASNKQRSKGKTNFNTTPEVSERKLWDRACAVQPDASHPPNLKEDGTVSGRSCGARSRGNIKFGKMPPVPKRPCSESIDDSMNDSLNSSMDESTERRIKRISIEGNIGESFYFDEKRI